MKNIKTISFFTAALLGLTANSSASLIETAGQHIQFIRAVGQFQDPQFSNTLEVWLTTPMSFPAGSPCTEGRRVYIDSKNYHLVAAAYMAFAKGRSVNIAVDDTLPIRVGSCEVTYLDVLAQ
jgi:hypothetical protein